MCLSVVRRFYGIDDLLKISWITLQTIRGGNHNLGGFINP